MVNLSTESITAIVGYVLFAVSEILSVLDIPTNGILQSFMLGLKNAFLNPKPQIKDIVANDPQYQKLMTYLYNDSSTRNFISNMIDNPQVKTNDLKSFIINMDNTTRIEDPNLEMIKPYLDSNMVNTVKSLINQPRLVSVINKIKDKETILNDVENIILTHEQLNPPSPIY